MTADNAASGADVRAFPPELPALTSVRFFLAAGVAFFHYHLHWQFADTEQTYVLERARLGVDVFFILSGFILTHVYHQQVEQGRYSHARFLVARFARVYPMHLAALALMVAMVLGAALVGAQYDAAAYGAVDLLRAVTLTQSWWVSPPINHWNGPSWSLSAEWFAYSAFPVFAYVGLRLRNRPWLLLTIAVVLFLLVDIAYQAAFGKILPHAEEQLGILRIMPEFLYGVALYRLGEGWTQHRSAAILSATAASALMLALMHLAIDDRLIVAAAGLVILSLGALSKTGSAGFLESKPLVLLGEASYALYLLHMPILIIWRNLAVMLDGRSSTYAMPLWEVLVVFGATLLASVLAHLWWERPARDWIRRRVDRFGPRPVSPPQPGSQPPDY